MTTVAARRSGPYPKPEPGCPARVAFVGPDVLFQDATPSGVVPGLDCRFINHRADSDADALTATLRDVAPHVVVCFRPEHIAAELFADLRAAVLGVAAEPLPSGDEERPHDGLEWNLAELAKADARSFDRLLLCHPAGFDAAAAILPAWRAQPLPVDDRLFRAVRRARRPPRAVFIGPSTMHAEQYLVRVKHGFDIGHYASGLAGDMLEEVLDGADVGINVHADDRVRAFSHRVVLHLAAGHLLLSEPIEPPFAFEPDIDYLQIDSADDLDLRMHQVTQRPDAYERVRIRGRNKAEQYRASQVWPALVEDLFADLAAFGTDRVRTTANA